MAFLQLPKEKVTPMPGIIQPKSNLAMLNQVPNAVQPTTPTTPTINGVNPLLSQLTEAQKTSAYAGLDKARTNALTSLDTEQAKIQPAFYDKRRQEGIASENNKRVFNEWLASRNLSQSGLAGHAEINRMSDLSTAKGLLNKQEMDAMTDIERRRSGVESDYGFDKAGIDAGINASALEMRIAEMQRQEDIAMQKDRWKVEDSHWEADQKLKEEEIAWSKNANNPAVKAQILANKINELELKNLPQKQKLEIESIKQDLATGKINQDIARKELNNIQSGKTRSGGTPSGTKPKTVSTDTKGNTKAQNSNFQIVKNEATTENWTPEQVIDYLLEDPDNANDMGNSNYTTWLNDARNTNYNNILNNWRSADKQGLINALNEKPEYWKKQLGTQNFNALIGKAQAAIGKYGAADSKKGW